MKLVTQGKVLKALHLGANIIVEHIQRPEPKKTYRLSNNHKIVHPDMVAMLLAEGLIQQNADGLPGIGECQTYSIRRNLPSQI